MPAGDLTTIENLKAYLGILPAWAASTTYYLGDKVRANNAQYACITAGISASDGLGPSGKTADITDGAAHWKYEADALASDDLTLARMITAVSTFFAGYCDRQFESASHTYVRNGTGGKFITLPDSPVTAITSVTIGSLSVPARSTVGSFGFVLDGTSVWLDGGGKFDRGIKNVSIVYTAGYASTPLDLEQACIECCASWYRRRTRVDEVSKGIGNGETLTFSTADTPNSAKSILYFYQRPWPR